MAEKNKLIEVIKTFGISTWNYLGIIGQAVKHFIFGKPETNLKKYIGGRTTKTTTTSIKSKK